MPEDRPLPPGSSAAAPDDPRRPTLTLSVGARLALVLGSLLVTLLLLEVALVIIGYEYAPMNIQIGQAGDARGFHVFEDGNFEYDPDLI